MPQKFLPGLGAAFIAEERGVRMGIKRRCREFTGARTFHSWPGSWTHYIEPWGLVV